MDVLELREDQFPSQVAQVQQHAAVDAASRFDLRLFGAGYHVAGGEFLHLGGVVLHEALALGVEQVSTLASCGFREKHAVAREGRRVVLHHLHVQHRRACAVGKRHAVAGADEGVGAGFERSSDATSREDDRLGCDGPNLAGEHLHSDDATALAVLDDEVGDEPFLVGADACLDDLLVHDVQDRLARDVGHEEGARVARTAERPRPQPSLIVAVEDDAHVLQRNDLAGRFDAHVFDGVLVAEVVGALHRVEDMGIDGIVFTAERCVDAALSSIRMAPHRVHLAHHRHVRAHPVRCDRGPHPCQPRPHNQNVMVNHGCCFHLPRESRNVLPTIAKPPFHEQRARMSVRRAMRARFLPCPRSTPATSC